VVVAGTANAGDWPKGMTKVVTRVTKRKRAVEVFKTRLAITTLHGPRHKLRERAIAKPKIELQ
jgi:hypothetical protein